MQGRLEDSLARWREHSTSTPMATRLSSFKGVQAAVRAALHAMAADGVNIALLPVVGGGLYAGPWRARLQSDFPCMLASLLNEVVDGGPLGARFDSVVLVTLQ